jgi:hypothetical protein
LRGTFAHFQPFSQTGTLSALHFTTVPNAGCKKQRKTKMEKPATQAIVIFFTVAALTTACFAPALAMQKDQKYYDATHYHRPIAKGYLA